MSRQIDLCAEELHNSVPSAVAIQSDIAPATDYLGNMLKDRKWRADRNGPWWKSLTEKAEKNKQSVHVSITLIALWNLRFQMWLIVAHMYSFTAYVDGH